MKSSSACNELARSSGISRRVSPLTSKWLFFTDGYICPYLDPRHPSVDRFASMKVAATIIARACATVSGLFSLVCVSFELGERMYGKTYCSSPKGRPDEISRASLVVK
jgi:hypothetical protein